MLQYNILFCSTENKRETPTVAKKDGEITIETLLKVLKLFQWHLTPQWKYEILSSSSEETKYIMNVAIFWGIAACNLYVN
jgi:hypothetical protein